MKINLLRLSLPVLIGFAFILQALSLYPQYFESFEHHETRFAEDNLPGWFTMTGDGEAAFYQRFTGNSAMLKVDPLQDKRNIWYAFMHQDIADDLDLEMLKLPDYQLRMEVRVRTSHAPRRINMYVFELDKDKRTGYLREFDIGRAGEWTTLSMVTDNINPHVNNPLMVQVSLMDWGISELMTLEIDYIRADVVSVSDSLPQYGLPLIYRPPLKDAGFFKNRLKAHHAATIDNAYPDVNFNSLIAETDSARILSVNNTSMILLSWDFSSVLESEVDGSGQLEIFTHAVSRLSDSPKDFGEIRVYEILNGKENWHRETITRNRFFNEKHPEKVINGQTIIDVRVNPKQGGATKITISKPVMDRLISGQTQGLAIFPLGYVVASFYAGDGSAPVLCFNLKEKQSAQK